ncbi:MAG: hypothetical protein MI743_16480 [Sneathiellales bacterium]|nr:hypothetical protein [Sneathiellales bacterium]
MGLLIRVLRIVPIIGWFIKDAQEGTVSSKIAFFANLGMGWVLAIYFFGYPAVILPALIAVPCMFLILIGITAQDGFPSLRKN